MRGYFYRRNGGGIGTADNRLYSACAVSFLYYILISLCIAPVIYLTVLLNRESSAYISCVVFLSIVLSHFDSENHYLFALQRMLETVAGIFTAVAVNKIIRNQDNKQERKES